MPSPAQKSSYEGRPHEAASEGLAALPLQAADQHQGVCRLVNPLPFDI